MIRLKRRAGGRARGRCTYSGVTDHGIWRTANKIPNVAVLLCVCFLAPAGCGVQRPLTNGNDAPSTNAQITQTPDAIPGSETPHQYNFTAIDNLLEQAAPRLGGCALLLVKDEKIVYRKAFGRYAVDKVVPVASASKWLSGAVIMSLVGDGKLSLDDPVSKYLPEFSGDKANITIRQLFAHTSGLPPESHCRNDKSTTLARCAAEIARLPLRSKPGEEFYYGGVSMHLGGRIAEIVSGKSWNELFAEKIAAPLGMTRTDFFAYGQTANPRPEGDVRSSLDDYGRFLQMILNRGNFRGTQILTAESVAEMHRDQTGGASIVYTIYQKFGRLDPRLPRARYGVGVWLEKVDDANGRLLEASSQGALGFSPWLDLEHNVAGVLSVQSSMSSVMPLYLKLKEELRLTFTKVAYSQAN